MGTRPNKICQMHVTDVKMTPKGTWYLHVIATADDDDVDIGSKKTQKTKASRRRIPLHPTLIAMGFLQFVAERKKTTGSPQLFGELKADKHGNFAWYPLKRFRETFLKKTVKPKARQSFYSLRHNFRDALRRAEAPPDALQALGGWSQGQLTSNNYGDKADPDYQRQFIEKVEYPGLDISHLLLKGSAEKPTA